MWVDRSMEPLLRERASTRPVVILTGARQTGKTSLVRRVFPNHSYVSLDLPSEAEEAEANSDWFLARHPTPVIIDEFQYAPALLRHVKSAVDRERHRRGTFVLIGSQPFSLMKSLADSLAGRASVVQLEPLSYAEAKATVPELATEDFLVRGGFPELWADSKIDSREFYRSYVATYLERDLRQLLQVISLRDFQRFLQASAMRTAQLLSRADLAHDVAVSGSTDSAGISVLEASYQIMLLEPWFGNRAKSLIKRPKLYMRDTGFASFLCGVHTSADLSSSPFVGALWETLVCAEIRRAQLNRLGGYDLNFWHDGVLEADFLLHRGGNFHLADAKWIRHPQSRDAASLKKVAKHLPADSVRTMSVICRAQNPIPITADIDALPLGALFESPHWTS